MLRSPKEERAANPKRSRAKASSAHEAIGNGVLGISFTEGQNAIGVGVCGSSRLGEPSRASFTGFASRRGNATAGCDWEKGGYYVTSDLVGRPADGTPRLFAGVAETGT